MAYMSTESVVYDVPRRVSHVMLRCMAVMFFSVLGIVGYASDDYLFTSVDFGRTLADNELRSIIQIPDGRMVFATESDMTLYDGENAVRLPIGGVEMLDIPGYNGFTHLYIDRDSLLWYKNYGKMTAVNLRRECVVPLTADSVLSVGNIDDFFVDNFGARWRRVGSRLYSDGITVGLDFSDGELQDLMRDEEMLYLFFNQGNVVAYSLADGARIYRSDAYPEAERGDFKNTSLVCCSPTGFYQLRTGRKSGFFHFNPSTGKWRKILETDYSLNTLALTDGGYAIISTRKGLWIIDTDNLEKRYLSHIRISGGNALLTEISTVFVDRDGGLWLGTFNRGLMYTHPNKYFCKKIPVNSGISSSVRNNGGFFEDRNGRVYIYGGRKVFRLDSGNEVAEEITDGGMSAYGHTRYDGGASFVASDGSEYFMDSDAVSVFIPNADSIPRLSFAPLLSGLYLHGEKVVPGREYGTRVLVPESYSAVDKLDLRHDQNFLSLEYSALNYMAPMKDISLVHYLEGNDKHPMLRELDGSGGVRIGYTNLSPGKYKLHVYLADSAGRRISPESVMDIRIRTPWWSSTIAYVLYLLLAVVVVANGMWLYSRWTRNRYRRRHREEMLLLRMKGLVEQCERYEAERKAYMDKVAGNEPVACMSETPEERLSESDKEFISRAAELVEANIHVPGYSVEQLSRDLCMERTGLYRKLVALLDKSPSLFIRSVRLRRASRLLVDNPSMSVAEVAELTGFSSGSYFSKCFQEEFGCRPSEYAVKHGKST